MLIEYEHSCSLSPNRILVLQANDVMLFMYLGNYGDIVKVELAMDRQVIFWALLLPYFQSVLRTNIQ